MNEEDYKRMNRNLEEFKKEVLQSKETALAFLIQAGVATEDGQLAEPCRSYGSTPENVSDRSDKS